MGGGEILASVENVLGKVLGVWRGDSFINFLWVVERRDSSAFDLDLPHLMGRNMFSSSSSIT